MNTLTPGRLGDDAKPEITSLLQRWQQGDSTAEARLFHVIYDELRKLAHSHLKRQQPGHTIQTTELIHEAYMKLAEQSNIEIQNRHAFYGYVSRVMRHLLVDQARGRLSQKRGDGQRPDPLDDALMIAEQKSQELLALDDALSDLAKYQPTLVTVVELRYFSGLSIEKTAEEMNISISTVKRYWESAKAWLGSELRNSVK